MADIDAPKMMSLPGVQTARPVEPDKNTGNGINVLSLPGVSSKTPEMDAKVREAQAFIQNTMSSENPEDTAVKAGLAWYLSDTFKIPFSEALQHQDLYLDEYEKLGKGRKTIWEQTSDHFSASLQNMVIGRQIYRSIHTKDPEKKKVLQADIAKRKSELPSTEADVTTGLASYLSAGADFAGSMVIPALVTTLVSAVAQPALPVALSAFGVAAPKIAKIGSMLIRVGAGWRETAIAETGLLYDRMTENGVPEEVAKKYAEEYGWLAGGIEMIELETAFTTLPFLGQAGKTAFGLLMARNFMTQEGLKTIGQIAARTGTTLAINTATNTFQETWQQIEEEKFYKKANLDDLKDFEPEIRERMGRQYDEWYTDYIHTLKERNEYFGSEQYAEEYAKAVWDTFVNAAKGSVALFGVGSGVQALVDVSKMTLSNSERLRRKVEQEKRKDTLNKEKEELKDKPETEYNRKRNEAVDEELADIDRQESEDTEDALRENVRAAEEKFYAEPTDETRKGLDEARQALDEYEKGTNISDTERTYNEQLENEEFTEEDADSLIESDQRLQREQKRGYRYYDPQDDWTQAVEEQPESLSESDRERAINVIKERTPNKPTDLEAEVVVNALLTPLKNSVRLPMNSVLDAIFEPEIAVNAEADQTINLYGHEVSLKTDEKGRRPKAAVWFNPDDGKAIVILTKDADFSSWVHEVGHIIRRYVRGDMQKTLEDFYKVVDGKWTVAQEEAFTEHLTTYLMTRQAPTPGLKSVFRVIADGLWNIYKTLSGRAEINDDIARVFDQMFADPESAFSENVSQDYNYDSDSMLYQTTPTQQEIAEAERQYKEIEAKYKGTDQWLKAPNGQPTKLTERQWVQVRTPNFKAWFGDWENDPDNASKVLDPDTKEPLVVYHGTDASERFDVFDGDYVFFDDTQEDAEYFSRGFGKEKDRRIIPAFLKIDNPLIVNARGKEWNDIKTPKEIKSFIEEATTTTDELSYITKATKKFSGVIIKNVIEGNGSRVNDYIAFSPEQIKSATDNVGTFSQSNPSILFQTDTEYLDAVNSGDMAKAQAMVDQRAREQGYTRKLFHSTNADNIKVLKFNNGGIYTTDNREMSQTYGRNTLELYGKEGMNVLTVDAKNSPHFAIPIPDDFDISHYPFFRGATTLKTNELARLAWAKGYDVVVVNNVYDDQFTGDDIGTDVIYRESNQVKSADPVTYDDNGNVIPLSERFNEQNNSLLYQENEEIYRDATENGEYVPDDIIDQYRGQEWAENEIQARDYYRKAANDYDTFEQFLASMESLDSDKTDEYYQQIWDSRLDAYSDYEVMLPQITKRMMEKMLRLLKKLAKKGKATLPEGLLGEYVKNFKKGLTDKEYSELMSEIKSAPDKYISFLSSCFSDQTEFEQLMQTLATHPDYEVRTLKKLAEELRKKNKMTLAEYDKRIKELERQYREALRNGEKAERRAERLQELRKAQNERAYYQRLVRIIFRKPPKMCLNEIANKILAIQAQFSPSTLLDKTRAKLQMEMMNSTDRNLQKALKQRLDRKSLREMSLDEVAEIAAEITRLRREGVEARMAQLMDIKEANLSWIDRLLTAIGETDPLDRTGSVESKDNKGSIYNRFVAYWSDIHRMTDMMGKAWGEWLGRIKKAHEDEMRNVDRRRTAFNEKMAELKLDDKLLAKVEEIKGDQFITDEKGNKYTHDILMCWYAYTQNEDSMAALIFGNFKGNPEMEDRMRKIYATLDEGISRLTKEEKELVDWAIESFSGEDWQRISDAIRIVENRSPEKIARYFPMMRVLDSTADVQSEPLVDLGDRSAGAKRTSVKKGFTKERIHDINWRYQKPLQLGFMSNYLKAIQNQEHYIAFAQLSKDMKYVYGNLEEAVTSKYGKAWSDSMRAWIDRTINPNVYNNFYNQQTMLDKLISNTVVGSLAYNMLSWLKQFPSVMFFLPYCSGGSLMNSFYHYVTDFKKMTEFAKERSPYLKNRSIDDIITLVNKRLRDPNSKTKALDKFVEWGMKPYSWFDEFACVIGWNAVYTTEMEKGATEEQAIDKANEALLKTQPQADALFSPVAYANPKLRPLLLFTRQANQITQMVVADFRNKGLSEEQMAEKVKFFYRLVFCVAFNALLMGWAGRKFAGYGDDDKDKSVAEDVLREIGANMAYNFPLVGGTIANTIQRKGYTAGGFVDPLSDLVGTAGNFTNKPIKNGEFNYDQLMRMITAAMGTAGLPKVATQRAYNAIKENDLWYIIMGSPLGGKNGNK